MDVERRRHRHTVTREGINHLIDRTHHILHSLSARSIHPPFAMYPLLITFLPYIPCVL